VPRVQSIDTVTRSRIARMSSASDPFEFVKSLWGQMGIPGFPAGAPGAPPMPSFAPEELERRVAELRQVRQWVEMNLGVLNMQISALEMQAATLRGMHAAPGADIVARAAEAMRQAAQGMVPGAAPAPPAPAAAALGAASAGANPAPWPDPTGWVQTLQGEFVKNMQAMAAPDAKAATTSRKRTPRKRP
jgi:hypothetical protein